MWFSTFYSVTLLTAHTSIELESPKTKQAKAPTENLSHKKNLENTAAKINIRNAINSVAPLGV